MNLLIKSMRVGAKCVRVKEENEHQETRNAKARGKSLKKRLREKGNLNVKEGDEIGN